MQSIGSAAGFCTIHQMDKMFIGNANATEPTCIRCVADARPKQGRTVIAEDPGENYFKGKGTVAKVTMLDGTKSVMKVSGATLEEIVVDALLNLSKLPMPKDVKEFKKIQKIIKTLRSLVENANG